MDRIEKVQLPDMGSYQCAVLTESQETYSEEGSIQLEGEFNHSLYTPKRRGLFNVCIIQLTMPIPGRPTSFLCRATSHVCSGQCVFEPALCCPRPSRASQGHLATGRCSPQCPK